jgi:class 3 adenylate cyclase
VEEKRLVILLADISGYTRFMIENRTSAVHGQICINLLIESILREVDIPLTLHEIEGDAVFLYAAHPGDDEAWREVLEQVSRKLERFFAAFIEQSGFATEATPCGCAICRNADRLGLKIIVHAGKAVFHEVAGRPQVSGPDVILAHRLLKNSIEGDEYLLLTGAAYGLMRQHLSGDFEELSENCEGFGPTPVRVRMLTQEFLDARDAVYRLDEDASKAAVREYGASMRRGTRRAAMDQLRRPIRTSGWIDRALMVCESFVMTPLALLHETRAIPKRQRARGQRRTTWKNRGE